MSNINKHILFYDSSCLICQSSVRFLLKFYLPKNLYFASLSSDVFAKILLQEKIENFKIDSVVFYKKGSLLVKSRAAEELLKGIPMLYFLYILSILPRSLKDEIYDFIARNRYNWFAPVKSCPLPDSKTMHRFLK